MDGSTDSLDERIAEEVAGYCDWIISGQDMFFGDVSPEIFSWPSPTDSSSSPGGISWPSESSRDFSYTPEAAPYQPPYVEATWPKPTASDCPQDKETTPDQHPPHPDQTGPITDYPKGLDTASYKPPHVESRALATRLDSIWKSQVAAMPGYKLKSDFRHLSSKFSAWGNHFWDCKIDQKTILRDENKYQLLFNDILGALNMYTYEMHNEIEKYFAEPVAKKSRVRIKRSQSREDYINHKNEEFANERKRRDLEKKHKKSMKHHLRLLEQLVERLESMLPQLDAERKNDVVNV